MRGRGNEILKGGKKCLTFFAAFGIWELRRGKQCEHIRKT